MADTVPVSITVRALRGLTTSAPGAAAAHLLSAASVAARAACRGGARGGLDVEDVAAEAAYRAFRMVSRSTVVDRVLDGHLDPWMYGIARNVVREAHRALARVRRQRAPGYDGSRRASIARERIARLGVSPAAVRVALTERQWEALRLHLEGLPLSVIAVRLGCSRSAARDRVSAATQRARNPGACSRPGRTLVPVDWDVGHDETLSRRQREVLELWRAGATRRQIASRLGSTRGAIAALLRRALRHRPSSA